MVFYYDPAAFKVGVAVSLAALAGVALVATVRLCRHRRRPAAEDERA